MIKPPPLIKSCLNNQDMLIDDLPYYVKEKVERTLIPISLPSYATDPIINQLIRLTRRCPKTARFNPSSLLKNH